MSKPRQSLNRMVPWNQLLDLLGAKIQAMGLPTRCRCPLCQKGVFRIDEDPVVGGQWFSCQRCGKQGDMIELAAAVWNLDIPATVVRLARHGLMLPIEPKAISRYEQQHVQYRQRLNGLWKDAQAGQIFRSHTLQRLLDRLGLHSEGTEQAWNNGPGRLIGGIDKVSVESCFAPRVMKHAQARRQHVNPSALALFRGGDWSDVLTVPLYDLPGRICAFLCIGREADPDGDFVLKCANFGSAANQHCSPPVEAGLAMHPDVLTHAESWDNTVVAVNDLVTALRLQIRHLRNSLHPLPLAVWIDTVTGPAAQTSGRRARTKNAWRMLENRQIVFWMPYFDLATIRQAIQVDGLISTVGPREESEQALKEYLWKTVPCDLFKQIQKHARPSHEVLSSALSSMSAVDIEEVLLRLEDEGDDVESILRRCGGDVRNRVAEIQSAIDLPRRVTLNRRTILETKEGWYVVSKRSEQRELISDAILRIDFAVPHRRLGTVYYQGRVLYKGEEVPFLERKDRVEKDTLNWMQNLLYQREVGAIMFNPDWTRRIVTIAGRFQETKLLEGVDTVGWNNNQQCFALPSYSIHLGGDVKPNEGAIFPEDVPGRQLEEPIVLSGEELDRPATDDALAGLFWATAACVLSNILARAFNRQPCGIALEGEGAISVGMTVAESLGCPMHRLGDAKQVRRALDDEGTHQWPIAFQPTAMVQRRYRRQLVEGAGDDRNCIQALSWETGRVLGIKGGWHMIASNRRNVRVGPEVHDLARKLIPSYLRNLCARQLQLDGWQDPKQPFVDRVLNDLARFVEEHHADPQAVLAAQDVLLPDRDGSRAEAFADLVGYFVKAGRLNIAAEGDWRGKPTLIESTAGGLYLSQQVLAKLLKDQPVEPPAIDDVATVLAAEGVLIEARDDGWVFDEVWFRTRQRLQAEVMTLHG